jgi:hypothetical protein
MYCKSLEEALCKVPEGYVWVSVGCVWGVHVPGGGYFELRKGDRKVGCVIELMNPGGFYWVGFDCRGIGDNPLIKTGNLLEVSQAVVDLVSGGNNMFTFKKQVQAPTVSGQPFDEPVPGEEVPIKFKRMAKNKYPKGDIRNGPCPEHINAALFFLKIGITPGDPVRIDPECFPYIRKAIKNIKGKFVEKPSVSEDSFPKYHDLLDHLCNELRVPGSPSYWEAVAYIKGKMERAGIL